MRKRIEEVEAGDALDLAGDRYADPGASNPTYAFERAEVTAVGRESDGWIRLDFEGMPSVSFPAEHAVDAAAPRDVPGAGGPR